jgi:tRNA dimethylallyltransferase
MEQPPLVVIAGPTASGKSALALRMAQEQQGTILNADASQLYRDIPVLSAQPAPEDRADVPHLLYGILDAADPCSAARWAELARAAIAAVHSAGRLPILVGGTGLYLRTLLLGIAPVPAIPAAVREAVRALSPAAVRAALEAEDPAMAARLHPNDPQRNARALEVARGTGRSLIHWQAATSGGIARQVALESWLVLPPAGELGQRIDARFDRMMAEGALEEVRRLAHRQLPPGLPAMKALGVAPLLAHLRGELALPDAVALAKRQSRAYAKRQRTWFASGRQAQLLADATRLQSS